jgi:hypothetical protein
LTLYTKTLGMGEEGGSQAFGVFVSDEGLVEAGSRQVSVFELHTRDDGVVELGVLHVGLGKVHAVNHRVRQVGPCFTSLPQSRSTTGMLSGYCVRLAVILLLDLLYGCCRRGR